MGFQARKSFKVMPGVRMTVSKSGVSASAGVRGARVSASSSGRVTRTVGVPGTGVYHTKTIRSGGSSPARAARSAPTPPPTPAKPGMLAPKWEKELYRAITTQTFSNLPQIAQTYRECAPLATALDGLIASQAGNSARALEACRYGWAYGPDLEKHPFVQKYISGTAVTVDVAAGISVTLPLSRDALGLSLAELEQEAGNIDEAIAVVEALDPSSIAAVSLCELYLEADRYDDVVDVTNGLTNIDDQTALLITFRGVALREQGHHGAAREALKEALKSKSRDSAIRHKALIERAATYEAEGKKAMARKDLERVLAEDASFPGIHERLEAITATED